MDVKLGVQMGKVHVKHSFKRSSFGIHFIKHVGVNIGLNMGVNMSVIMAENMLMQESYKTL